MFTSIRLDEDEFAHAKATADSGIQSNVIVAAVEVTVTGTYIADRDDRVLVSNTQKHQFAFSRQHRPRLVLPGQSAILRLRPLWNDQPRYASDIMIPVDLPYQRCWNEWMSSKNGKSD